MECVDANKGTTVVGRKPRGNYCIIGSFDDEYTGTIRV